MQTIRRTFALATLALLLMTQAALFAEDAAWPPKLPGADANGTVTVKTDKFLEVPEFVQQHRNDEGAVPFVVAKEAPTVDLAYHGNLPYPAINGTGWTSWGDICVASDGRVYVGVGDHGPDAAGKAYCFIYRWDPKVKKLEQIIDIREVTTPQPGRDPSWSKVHARIVEGSDNNIYFTCTLNNGGLANQTKWTEHIPGGQIFKFEPATGKTTIVGHFDGMVTPTTLIDRDRMIFYANLESELELGAYDLKTNKLIYTGEPGSVGLNRNIALANNGHVYYNGSDGQIWDYDPDAKKASPSGMKFPAGQMRSSTRQAKDGWIYGTTMGPHRLFRMNPAQKKVEILGPEFLTGNYVTVTVLSPDERFVYCLSGAHGHAKNLSCPVIQYDVKTGQRKVIAFLGNGFVAQHYTPGGTYGVKMSADGSTLYVNLNGHGDDSVRLKGMNPTGFGLQAFAAIHIPESER